MVTLSTSLAAAQYCFTELQPAAEYEEREKEKRNKTKRNRILYKTLFGCVLLLSFFPTWAAAVHERVATSG